MGNESLWEIVGNGCLKKAADLLQKDTALNADTIEAVKQLVDVAIAIDALNLHWAQQNRFSSAGHLDQLLGQP